MSPKWIELMKKWETKKREQMAEAVMRPPVHTTLLKVIPFPGVVLIMGDRGAGKTATACAIMEAFHNGRYQLGGTVKLPEALPKGKKRIFPSWIKPVYKIKDLPHRSACLIDEASQIAHARRSQSTANLDMDNLVSISRQRQQLILLVCHHSRKIDLNDVHSSSLIVWKQPTYADTLWERDELQRYSLRAIDFFEGLKTKQARLRASFMMDLRHMKFYSMNNGLPSWWNDDLSAVFSLFKPSED